LSFAEALRSETIMTKSLSSSSLNFSLSQFAFAYSRNTFL